MTLEPLPKGFGRTRDALHQLAYFVLSPARYRATGRIGLVATPGGFGTPGFDGRVIRVDGAMIVDSRGDVSGTRPITTIGDATAFVGIEYEELWFPDFGDLLAPVGPGAPLDVDAGASSTLGLMFAFAWEVLAEVRAGSDRSDALTDTQLWPEHFDAAAEGGDEAAGSRASVGLSPGDADHPEPYLYVSPWSKDRAEGPFWNDPAFGGASLSYQRLLGSADPHGDAVDFLETGIGLLSKPV